MMYGIDVSHWNDVSVFNRAKGLNNEDIKFCIIKATEGKIFFDKEMNAFAEAAKSRNLLLGFYHYCRADVNEPEEEAEHFYETVKPYIGKAIFAFDWEGKSLKTSPDWLLKCCKCFEELSGVKPIVYASASVLKSLDCVAKNGNGVWVAEYNNQISTSKKYESPFPFWAIHQYTSTGGTLDMNVFNGSETAWGKYCEVKKEESEKDDYKEKVRAAFCKMGNDIDNAVHECIMTILQE